MVTIHTIKSPNQLLDKLCLIQKTANLSDYKFADRLGVERILWYTTRTQRRKIGFTLLKAISRTYPELKDDIFNFLRSEDHDKET